MKVYSIITEIKEELNSLIDSGKSIGFVPTMGALHEGHLSLVEASKRENDVTVVSIFVNPIQFNKKQDLVSYPREVENDLEKLQSIDCDIVFCPEADEMYPEPDNTTYDFGLIDKVMEGKYRENHFNGVAVVVSKLFDIVNPDRAYFGKKDFQQVAVIKDLVRQLHLPLEIIDCPIIREHDGLAMSSRNVRLTDEQRKNVSLISKTLFESVEKAQTLTADQTKKWVIEKLSSNTFLEVEYFEIVDDTELKTVANWSDRCNKVGCVAVNVGNVRLIDNIL
jgi:pantoate--beta-alanine ligase